MEILEKIDFAPNSALDPWDDIEIQPVFCDEDGNCEVCNEGEQTFYSVYLHQVSGGVLCIADLPTLELAQNLASLIKNACGSYLDLNKYPVLKH